MLRDDAYLFDILESSRTALEYMREKTWEEFSGDPLFKTRLFVGSKLLVRHQAEFHRKHKKDMLTFRGRR